VTSDLVRTLIEEVWNQRRLDLLDGLAADDYELRNFADGSVATRGRQGLRAHIEERLRAFPDLRLLETDHLTDGERVASVARIIGCHVGAAFRGIEPGGARIDVAIVGIFTGDGERLVSHSTLLDTRRLLEQLEFR